VLAEHRARDHQTLPLNRTSGECHVGPRRHLGKQVESTGRTRHVEGVLQPLVDHVTLELQGVGHLYTFLERPGQQPDLVDAFEQLEAPLRSDPGVDLVHDQLIHILVIEQIFRFPEGKFIAILAKATIMATGGHAKMYLVTSNCRGNTGDGLALALHAGLPVMDLEAVQFHPTGMVGPGILASEALRGEGAILRNKDEEPFMERYAPTAKDLAPRDLISRAIMQEMREGRGLYHEGHKAQHVWLDLRHLPREVHEKKLQEVCSFFKRFVGVDPQTDLCPVTPTAHYQMGGIPTNEFTEVQRGPHAIVPGLFACGEVAAASLHGLNRLGTNSLLELITMGRVTGERVVEYLRDAKKPEGLPPDAGHIVFGQFSTYLSARGKQKYGEIRDTLRKLMMEEVGIFRTEESLLEAIESLRELKERAMHIPAGITSLKANQDLWQTWELNNLIMVSMVIAQGALMRKESRGGHFREDYPERSDQYNYHTLVYMPEFGEIAFDKRPIDMSIFEAKGEHFELFDYIKREY